MKKHNIFLYFALVFPFVFSLLFFVRYDVHLYTENVKGEGLAQTYITPLSPMATFYGRGFYFGSKLEKATIQGVHYDVDSMQFIISDVDSFDLIGHDTSIFGLTITKCNATSDLEKGKTIEGETGTLTVGDTLHVDVKDKNIGAYLNIKTAIPIWFWAVFWSISVLIGFLLAWLVRKVANEKIDTILLQMSASWVVLLCGSLICGSLPFLEFGNFFVNWLILFGVCFLIGSLTFSYLGVIVTSIFTMIWYIANYFVTLYRGKPIMPADISAINTAREVMKGYSYPVTWKMIVGCIIVAGYVALSIFLRTKQQIKIRLISAGVAVALIVIALFTPVSISDSNWDMRLLNNFNRSGMILTYLNAAYNQRVRKPDGYSREKVAEYLKDYKKDEASGIVPTNIIMVMNEAFSDLREVGLDKTIDVMPFIDTLNTGTLGVSVLGGGTCNTEFEALTGNSMAFLGDTYPYTSYVTRPLFSLASYLKNQGYQTDAFHGNLASSWNRNVVYPNLGFGKFHSIEDYRDVEYLHDHVSDETDYRNVESTIESGQQFLFDVTIQNHSGYETWGNLKEADAVKNTNLYPETRIYLSLIKESDNAVKDLIEKCEKMDEPTMIIFFGDHMPGLPAASQEEVFTDVNTVFDVYKTKYFIWTNYEADIEHELLSANFLPYKIVESANIPLCPYLQLLKEVHEKYPVISSQGAIDSNGNEYAKLDMSDPLIQKYAYVQYANMFDEIDSEWFANG